MDKPSVYSYVSNWFTSFWYTNVSQLTCKGDNKHNYIYKGDKLFTGTAWSDDGQTLKIVVNNGVLEEYTAYFANGQVAIYKVLVANENFVNASDLRISRDEIFYDVFSSKIKGLVGKNGKKLSPEQVFAIAYEKVYKAVQANIFVLTTPQM